jgi:hypothetical protein
MRKLICALVLVLAAGEVKADWPTVRTGALDPRTHAAVAAPARLQPVVGSVKQTSHFANPFTKKARYSAVTFNPVSGTFGKTKFKR